jgi:hypothetical protein
MKTEPKQYKQMLMEAKRANPKLYGEYISKKGTILDPLRGEPIENVKPINN